MIGRLISEYVDREKVLYFYTDNKPRGASPRRDYEDGISWNNLVLLLYYGVGNDT